MNALNARSVIVLFFVFSVFFVFSNRVFSKELPEGQVYCGGVHRVSGQSNVPLGIFIMIRSDDILNNNVDLERIMSRQWVSGIALGLHWNVLWPNSSDDAGDRFELVLNKIRSASLSSGRKCVTPIFLKLYPILPDWAVSDNDFQLMSVHKNKMGMMVFNLPSNKDITGKIIPGREYPVSTDLVYSEYRRRTLQKINQLLEEFDKNAELIPVVHVIGPAMQHNQMRLPEGKVYDLLSDIGWSKEKHIKSWIDSASDMGALSSFRKRTWVFNFTYNPPRANGRDYLTFDDQFRVFKAFVDHHPNGESGLIAKTESLAVAFGNPNIMKWVGGKSWRKIYLDKDQYSPYRFIAGRKCMHAWELWSSFFSGRDARNQSLYPIAELIKNSLYSDLALTDPKEEQGTLWVELWKDDALQADNIIDPVTGRSLDSIATEWNMKLSKSCAG